MALTNEQLTVIINADWKPFVEQLRKMIDAVVRWSKAWFPVISEAHRAEVKRVHTAYRRKKGKRW